MAQEFEIIPSPNITAGNLVWAKCADCGCKAVWALAVRSVLKDIECPTCHYQTSYGVVSRLGIVGARVQGTAPVAPAPTTTNPRIYGLLGVTGHLICDCGEETDTNHVDQREECSKCGAFWDYSRTHPRFAGSSLLCDGVLPTTPAPLPILHPYARVVHQQGHSSKWLECSCGDQLLRIFLATPVFSCAACQLEWLDADVQAASVGDLLPGTPIGQIQPLGPARQAQAKAISSVLNSHLPQIPPGPQSITPTTYAAWAAAGKPTPPTHLRGLKVYGPGLLDSGPTPKPPTLKAKGKTCSKCGGAWCEALDVHYGEKAYAGWCAPCRKAGGIGR